MSLKFSEVNFDNIYQNLTQKIADYIEKMQMEIAVGMMRHMFGLKE